MVFITLFSGWKLRRPSGLIFVYWLLPSLLLSSLRGHLPLLARTQMAFTLVQNATVPTPSPPQKKGTPHSTKQKVHMSGSKEVAVQLDQQHSAPNFRKDSCATHLERSMIFSLIPWQRWRWRNWNMMTTSSSVSESESHSCDFCRGQDIFVFSGNISRGNYVETSLPLKLTAFSADWACSITTTLLRSEEVHLKHFHTTWPSI